METLTHAFTDREAWLQLRRKNINSTDCAALFGLSPYQTALELALIKGAKIEESDVASERTKWGQRLQDAIALGVADEYDVRVQQVTDYMEVPELRIGSSFDCEIIGAGLTRADEFPTLRRYFDRLGPGVLEVKNLDPRMFANDWQIIDGELEAAPHIEIQLQHQLLVRGHKWGAIAALVGGNKLKLILREYDPAIGAAIAHRAQQFWMDLALEKYPPANMPADAAILAKLYNFSEPGTFLDGTDNEVLATACALYNQASLRAKMADEEKDVAKAEVLAIIQDNEKAVTAGYKISTWMVEPTEFVMKRPGYRSMRITKIKVKESK